MGSTKSAMGSIPDDRRLARMATVEQHVRFENAHDLNGVLGTFGDTAHYDDEAWGEHYNGRDGVRTFYVQLMSALPDLNIEILRRHTRRSHRSRSDDSWDSSRSMAGPSCDR